MQTIFIVKQKLFFFSHRGAACLKVVVTLSSTIFLSINVSLKGTQAFWSYTHIVGNSHLNSRTVVELTVAFMLQIL